MSGETRIHAVMATPVTSAQVAKARVRPDGGSTLLFRPWPDRQRFPCRRDHDAAALPRRLEPLHDPLSSSRRLMGVFDPVMNTPALPMRYSRPEPARQEGRQTPVLRAPQEAGSSTSCARHRQDEELRRGQARSAITDDPGSDAIGVTGVFP